MEREGNEKDRREWRKRIEKEGKGREWKRKRK